MHTPMILWFHLLVDTTCMMLRVIPIANTLVTLMSTVQLSLQHRYLQPILHLHLTHTIIPMGHLLGRLETGNPIPHHQLCHLLRGYLGNQCFLHSLYQFFNAPAKRLYASIGINDGIDMIVIVYVETSSAFDQTKDIWRNRETHLIVGSRCLYSHLVEDLLAYLYS